jgi:hypothetical protein
MLHGQLPDGMGGCGSDFASHGERGCIERLSAMA